MDSIDFGGVFAFADIDIFAKKAPVNLYPALTSLEGLDFPQPVPLRFKHVKLLPADGGSEIKRPGVYRSA
ncbi:hypothetical protein KBI33_03285 [Candidatus Shapirobacteria bacterium]|nr:hypothetical protein [Candidatus Shapirobacteria bacterium]